MTAPGPRRPSRRVPPPDPATAWQRVRLALRDHGLLLEADPALPNVAALVTGAPVHGSWWGHPAGRAIFAVTQMLARHPDALSARLVGGKVTWVHRRLWPALLAVANSGAAWQTAGLSPAARRLLERLRRDGELQVSGAAARELQERLLAVGASVHTQAGHHETQLLSWERWAARDGLASSTLSTEHGAHLLEEAARTLGGERAAACLPWRAEPQATLGRARPPRAPRRKKAAASPKKPGRRRPPP
ncbi:MAG TPA: hypothetical protein VFY71_08525 [Planctomycetota bacterium]|nr:hypothetical protein [Planctomycetota bacterium]